VITSSKSFAPMNGSELLLFKAFFSDASIATPAFSWLFFVWCIFSILLLSTYLCFSISCRKHIFDCYLKSIPTLLWLNCLIHSYLMLLFIQ
jgi:hypothetical protein